jgi:hypothetical protein
MDAFKTSGRDSPVKLHKSTTYLVSPLEPTIIFRNEEPSSSKWLKDTHPSKLDADMSGNPSLHYQFTKKDPPTSSEEGGDRKSCGFPHPSGDEIRRFRETELKNCSKIL